MTEAVEEFDITQEEIDNTMDFVDNSVMPTFFEMCEEESIFPDVAAFSVWINMMHGLFASGWSPTELIKEVTDHYETHLKWLEENEHVCPACSAGHTIN